MADDWLVGIKEALAERDRAQNIAFAALIQSQNEMFRTFKLLESKASSLEEENKTLRDKVDSLQRAVGGGKTGPVANPKEVEDLKTQMSELKERLLDTMTKESQAHQKLVLLNEQLRKKEEECKRKEDNEIKLHDQVFNLERQLKDAQETTANKDLTNQVLHDELQALQLELVKQEETMKTLEAENKALLERWLRKMNDEAASVNDANAFIEHVSQKKALAAAMEGPAVSEATSAVDRLQLRNTIAAVTGIPSNARKRLTAHEGEINSIEVSYGGTMFATGSSDKKVKVFDNSGNLKTVVRGATQSVMLVQFSKNDELILGACNDSATRIWNVESGRSRFTFTGHIGKVFSAKFSGDSTKVISGSHDRTIKVWDLSKGYCIRTIFSYSSCNDLCLSDDAGTNVISGHLDNHIRFWDTKSGDCVNEISGVHGGQVTSLTLAHSGNEVLTNSRDNTIKLIDLRMFQVVHTYSADAYKTGMNWAKSSFSPDGQYVVAGSADGSIFAWNTNTARLEKVLKGHSGAVAAVAWSSNGQQMFSADKDKTVIIWEAD